MCGGGGGAEGARSHSFSSVIQIFSFIHGLIEARMCGGGEEGGQIFSE